MPMYTFECKKCEKQVEVLNSFDEYKKPPEKPCECGSEDWQKLVDFSLTRYRFHD